ncbi:MAG: 3-dehydroquinate synthase [Methylobacteriaceae bacterium]|nr:3-dehydroquinate synthase [Methylobacteriaceae bacterium]
MHAPRAPQSREQALVEALGTRSIVLVGMMGCGKTSAGRRLAERFGLPFVDADHEIEAAHQMTIAEIFAKYGEPYFRDGERRVMARLLASGPNVIATGGGAFMNEQTRARIAESGISIWLRAEFDVLMKRVRRRPTRPLLQNPDPEGTLRRLMDERYPIYAKADVTVETRDAHYDAVVEDVMSALENYLATSPAIARPAPEIVRVELGARGYDIVIGEGAIAEAGARIVALAPKAACAIVTDENVAKAHLPTLQASLDAAGVRHSTIVVPPGENTKRYQWFEQVCEAIIAARIERGDFVVALGGGVIGDLAGFAAASVRRGVRFVQIPTTLLSQVDSSVGGKTGINSAHGKNLIGAFYQPSLVLADTAALETLPEREFRAGYAEVAKYGLIDAPDFFAWLEENWRAVFAGGRERIEAIARSCASKAAVVARDETEQGDRALLNLGHTFGHALERLVNYDGQRLVHGEGVAIGMASAFRFSAARGLCAGQDAERVAGHLRTVGLPTRIRDIAGWEAGPDAILEAMYQDKKVQQGSLTFILARGIGQSFIAKGVEPGEVRAFLEMELAAS